MKKEVDIKLPQLGESIVNATIVQWFKDEGDFIKLDEPLLEVSTDKVNSEIASPVSGRVTKILIRVGEEIDVGTTLALIETTDPLSGSSDAPISAEQLGPSTVAADPPKKGFFTSAILRLARERGVSLSELDQIPTTGEGGRLSKRDLENYLKGRGESSTKEAVDRIRMTPIRKVITDNVMRSFREIPHATLVSEIDVSDILHLISSERESFREKHGCKLTITSFIAHALVKAVKDFPLINASLQGDEISVRNEVNLGIAVSVEQGVLVPVISNCHELSLTEVTQRVAHLSDKARRGLLNPDQLRGGTLTLTNFGMSGVLLGTPIIRQEEVAIVGVGSINKKFMVFEDDTMGVRSVMYCTLTFDHRIFDGMYGCGYLSAIKHLLESGELVLY